MEAVPVSHPSGMNAFPETDIEPVQVHTQDIGSLLDHWAEHRPDHLALVRKPAKGESRTWTYRSCNSAEPSVGTGGSVFASGRQRDTVVVPVCLAIAEAPNDTAPLPGDHFSAEAASGCNILTRRRVDEGLAVDDHCGDGLVSVGDRSNEGGRIGITPDVDPLSRQSAKPQRQPQPLTEYAPRTPIDRHHPAIVPRSIRCNSVAQRPAPIYAAIRWLRASMNSMARWRYPR